jgi:hypothetical protein
MPDFAREMQGRNARKLAIPRMWIAVQEASLKDHRGENSGELKQDRLGADSVGAHVRKIVDLATRTKLHDQNSLGSVLPVYSRHLQSRIQGKVLGDLDGILGFIHEVSFLWQQLGQLVGQPIELELWERFLDQGSNDTNKCHVHPGETAHVVMLHFHRDLFSGGCEHGSVYLGQGGSSQRFRVEFREQLASLGAKLGENYPINIVH